MRHDKPADTVGELGGPASVAVYDGIPARGGGTPIASIVWWNATYLADAVDHLRGAGEPVSDALLAHTSPVGWEHIAFSSDFLWDRAAALPLGRRPLNLGRNAHRIA